MKKNTLLAKKLKISGEKNIFIPVYTEESYTKCKVGTIDDFYGLPCVEDIAYQTFLDLEGTSLESITFCVIDENYFKYLEENNLEDSNVTRENYCASLTNEEREILWKNNNYNEGYDWGVLPIIMENPSYIKLKQGETPEDSISNYALSYKTIEILKDNIYESFKQCNEEGVSYNIEKNDIYVAPYILKTPNFNNDALIDILFDEGVCALHGDELTINSKMSTQEMKKEEPIGFFGVFVLYKYQVPNVIDINYIENAKESTINLPSLDVEAIEKAMEEDIDITFELLTLNIVYPEYIEEAINEFKKYCLEKITEKVEALDTMNDMVSNHCKTNDKKKKKK